MRCEWCHISTHQHQPHRPRRRIHGQANPATAARVEAKNPGSLASKNFLDYPFEIWIMIYKDFFATESFKSSEASLELGKLLPAGDVSVFLDCVLTEMKALKKAFLSSADE